MKFSVNQEDLHVGFALAQVYSPGNYPDCCYSGKKM